MNPTEDPLPDASFLVANFRDVGETVNVLTGATVMKENTLWRGGEIDFVDNPAIIRTPRTIINLRKGRDPEMEGVAACYCPAPNSYDVYAVGKGHNRKWILLALEVLSDAAAEAPFYVHCAFGKDRTGVVVGALLMAIGLPREVVAEEYELSLGLLQPDLFAEALDGFEEDGFFRKVDVEGLRERFLTG